LNSCGYLVACSGFSPTVSSRSSTFFRLSFLLLYKPCISIPSAMMSATVQRGFNDEYGSWKIICICLCSSTLFFFASLSPLKYISPPVASYKLTRFLPVVYLPQPDSPTSPQVSPSYISQLTPSTALTSLFCHALKCCFSSVTSKSLLPSTF